MVCDDSAVIRGALTRALQSDPEIRVTATVPNGQQALDTLDRQDFDVIVLDIEMPVMDGLTALPKLLARRPDTKIIMASTLTRRNADISMQALQKGASDYIPKPSSSNHLSAEADSFKRELVAKVKALAAQRRGRAVPASAGPEPTKGSALAAIRPKGPLKLRSPSALQPNILAIGSSTGGPQALLHVLSDLKRDLARVPVLITQHMPPTFTAILSEHINRATGIKCAEAIQGEPVVPGRIYVAPGDFHMEVARDGVQKVIRLHQGPRENFCRPAVDPMFRSIVAAYGPSTLALILTGMGQDGYLGAKALIEAGGSLVAQDEQTSVVWGMPGAVATAGLCCAVLPLDGIGSQICRMLNGGKR
ncbi:MAG: chemotaxis response regulator protein-glutamate methylesterase [Alphaproteobacteria bacterium]